ncbi:MAG: metallophosphatase family protein [Bacteroidales bacterium]|nr:metallophosphatase family protein [Candidatus Latescibacterota bacterium]
MKILVLSDIHGNSDALKRVLAEARTIRPDRVVSLGDVVGYGADPARCVRLIDENADIRICGNHDLAVTGEQDYSTFNSIASISIEWTRNSLSEEEILKIKKYVPIYSSGECLYVHASPDNPLEWEYVYTVRQAERIFNKFKDQFIFVGHTHIPGIISWNKDDGVGICHSSLTTIDPSSRYLINTGSVGQPRDGINAASFTLLDLEKGTIQMHRSSYNVSSAQRRIRAEGLPDYLADRLARAR